MFDTKTRVSFFSYLTGAAGAALIWRLRLTAPTYKKIGSGSGAALKVAAPDPAPQHCTQYRLLN